MKQSSTLLLLLGLAPACFVAGAAEAQIRDLGLQLPRHPEAKAAGIESYTLVTSGEAASVEVFGPKSAFLAACEFNWPPGKTLMTCFVGEEKSPSRATWDWALPEAEFEDLVTGDRVKVGASPKEPIADSFQLQPGESPPHGEWNFSFEGTVSEEAARQRWGVTMRLLAVLAAEVETTLNKQHGKEVLAPAGTPNPSPPSPIQFCPDGQFPDCSSSFGFIGTGFSFSETTCCILASSDADFKCALHTGANCCANGLCTVGCTLGFLCSCTVGGWTWVCPECT